MGQGILWASDGSNPDAGLWREHIYGAHRPKRAAMSRFSGTNEIPMRHAANGAGGERQDSGYAPREDDPA
jgi:hypothetical protein